MPTITLPGCNAHVQIRSMSRADNKERLRLAREMAKLHERQAEESKTVGGLTITSEQVEQKLDEFNAQVEAVVRRLYPALNFDDMDARDYHILVNQTVEWTNGTPEADLKNFGPSGTTSAPQAA